MLSAATGLAEREDFTSENLRAALKGRIRHAEEKLSQTNDIFEKRSQEFLKIIDKQVDEGFVRLDSFRKDLDQQIE